MSVTSSAQPKPECFCGTLGANRSNEECLSKLILFGEASLNLDYAQD